MKKYVLPFLLFIFCISFALSGCSGHVLAAFIKEGTSAGSDIYTVNVTFAEDKEYDNKMVDILFMSSIDNLSIVFKREFDQDTNLLIKEKDRWYSLTLLLNQQGNGKNEKYMPFAQKHNITMLIESEQDAHLTIKVVCGDEYENSQGEIILINQMDISKPFKLVLGKNLDK